MLPVKGAEIMKVYKTALIRMKSRPGNTVLLTGIFVVLSLFLLILLGFYGLIEKKQLEYKKTIPGEVVIRSGETSYGKALEGYAFSESDLLRLMSDDQKNNSLLKNDRNIIRNKVAVAFGYADSFIVKKEEEMGITIQITNGTYHSREEIPDISVMGVLDSEKYNWFENNIYKLVEGDHITEIDDNSKVALISLGLAQNNHLVVGNKIRLKVEGATEPIEFTVKGIFSAVEKNMNASRSNHENRIILPIKTFEKYAGTDKLCEFDVQLSAAANADDFLYKIKNSSQAVFKSAKIITNNYDYVKKSSILSGMQQYLKITIGTLFVSSLLIIGLYSIYQNITRKREFIIFFSRGAAKIQIAGELFVEVLIPCLVGMVVSILLYSILYYGMSNYFSYQDIRTYTFTDIFNIRNLFVILGSEMMIIIFGNLMTFFHLLSKNTKWP